MHTSTFACVELGSGHACRGYLDWDEVGRTTHFGWFHSVGSDTRLYKRQKGNRALAWIHSCLLLGNKMGAAASSS